MHSVNFVKQFIVFRHAAPTFSPVHPRALNWFQLFVPFRNPQRENNFYRRRCKCVVCTFQPWRIRLYTCTMINRRTLVECCFEQTTCFRGNLTDGSYTSFRYSWTYAWVDRLHLIDLFKWIFDKREVFCRMVINIDGICGIYLRIFNKQVFLLYVSCGKFNCAFRTILLYA